MNIFVLFGIGPPVQSDIDNSTYSPLPPWHPEVKPKVNDLTNRPLQHVLLSNAVFYYLQQPLPLQVKGCHSDRLFIKVCSTLFVSCNTHTQENKKKSQSDSMIEVIPFILIFHLLNAPSAALSHLELDRQLLAVTLFSFVLKLLISYSQASLLSPPPLCCLRLRSSFYLVYSHMFFKLFLQLFSALLSKHGFSEKKAAERKKGDNAALLWHLLSESVFSYIYPGKKLLREHILLQWRSPSPFFTHVYSHKRI